MVDVPDALGQIVSQVLPARRQRPLEIGRLTQVRPALLGMRGKLGRVVRVKVARILVVGLATLGVHRIVCP